MRKTMISLALGGAVALGAGAAAVSTTSEAQAATTTTVKLRDIDEQLVPSKLVRGDREFGGNGPRIRSSVTLSVTADKKKILATVDFHAVETKSDWSETRGQWTRTVYVAPGGKKIESIVDGSTSTVQYVSKPAGFQLLAPAEDWAKVLQGLAKVNEALMLFHAPLSPSPASTSANLQMKTLAERALKNTSYLMGQGNRVDIRVPTSGPVRLFAMVGDTGGPDISTDDDPKDDTRLCAVKFKPIKIRLK